MEVPDDELFTWIVGRVAGRRQLPQRRSSMRSSHSMPHSHEQD